jgi:DNA-binding GntR family transcriptional regulator
MVLFFIPGSVRQSLQDHEEILYLIKQGKYGNDKECLRNHINYTAKVIEGKILQTTL